MVEINPTRISGRWSNGFTLDVHTASSELLGHDEYGHPQFASKRSELGELLYKLKFRRDQSVIPEIAAVVGTFAESYLPTVDLIVPVPPSTPRTEQPVILLAHAIGARIGIPVIEDCVWKVRETSQLKNIFDFDERLRLLDGAFEIDRSVANGKRVLLFDDLYRSGATLNAVTSLLYDPGGATDVAGANVNANSQSPMTKVFIAGSRKISKLSVEVLQRLDADSGEKPARCHRRRGRASTNLSSCICTEKIIATSKFSVPALVVATMLAIGRPGKWQSIQAGAILISMRRRMSACRRKLRSA